MLTRRHFAKLALRTGVASASAPLWLHETSARAFAQLPSSYKAIVVITLEGGNDGNNMLVPLDAAAYAQYASLRSFLALPQSSCIPLAANGSTQHFGLHPALPNVAALYNSGKAAIVANVGPLGQPTTKAQLTASPNLVPQQLLSHPAGVAQWESAGTLALPVTGWGGRMADLFATQSGTLPPLLDAAGASIFTVGRSVQGIAVRSGSSTASVLPSGIHDTILAIAGADSGSPNNIVAQAAKLRSQALQQQTLLNQAQSSGTPLKTVFPQGNFGESLATIAAVLNGRSVIGASRQIFYTQQGLYDTHGAQLGIHNGYLAELDAGLGAFMQALAEMNLTNQVLVCTHSDFNRTLVANGSGGSDHAWGNHQLILGGGIRGGRLLGTFPDLDLGGAMDLNGAGTWIPTLSVTQMTAGIGAWMGLNAPQLADVFPDLANFPTGPLALT